MDNTILIVCKFKGKQTDLLVPKDITADELINVINKQIRSQVQASQYIRSDNPKRLLTGAIPISRFGLHDGSILFL